MIQVKHQLSRGATEAHFKQVINMLNQTESNYNLNLPMILIIIRFLGHQIQSVIILIHH